MKKIHLALIVVVSFITVVFVNSYIPHSYDLIEQQEPIDIEKRLDILSETLTLCKEEGNPRLVAECEFPIKNEINMLEFKQKSKIFAVGPITYYYAGGQVDVSEQGMAVFNLEMLAENTGSSDTVVLHCSGAVSCNYHVWDGKTKFIFSSNNFAAGNIGINPARQNFSTSYLGQGRDMETMLILNMTLQKNILS